MRHIAFLVLLITIFYSMYFMSEKLRNEHESWTPFGAAIVIFTFVEIVFWCLYFIING